MQRPNDEHHVKPIAWVWAAGIIAASIGGAVFVTEWKPMTRTPPGAVAVKTPEAARRFVLPLDRPNLRVPLNRDPANPEAALYEGVSRLLGGDAAGALDPLNAAVRLSTGAAEQDARWYLAVALERVGRRTDAAAVLDRVCQMPGTVPGTARSRQACEAAATLRSARP